MPKIYTVKFERRLTIDVLAESREGGYVSD